MVESRGDLYSQTKKPDGEARRKTPGVSVYILINLISTSGVLLGLRRSEVPSASHDELMPIRRPRWDP